MKSMFLSLMENHDALTVKDRFTGARTHTGGKRTGWRLFVDMVRFHSRQVSLWTNSQLSHFNENLISDTSSFFFCFFLRSLLGESAALCVHEVRQPKVADRGRGDAAHCCVRGRFQQPLHARSLSPLTPSIKQK